MAIPRYRQPQTAQGRPDLADELWTLAHLARYLHCGRSTVFLTVSERGFPAALAVYPMRARYRRLWMAAEVRAWAVERTRIDEDRASPESPSPGTDA